MAFFNKEKISEMATKAKGSIKEGIDTAKAEQERRKELGLLNDVNLKLEYKGGHPALTKEKDCNLKITNEDITISYGISSATINYSAVTNIGFETAEQISRRITATRLVTLGVFAFAFKKKKKDSEKYLTVDFKENNIECAVMFSGKRAQDAYSRLYERYSNYLKRNNIQNTSEKQLSASDPYEELKKVKELLDMNVISQEEFNKKKKELLGL